MTAQKKMSTERPVLKITILTLFPEMFEAFLETSLLGKARTGGLIDINVVQIRDFTHDKHRSVDDTPYGGGCGMVMKCAPLAEAMDHTTARVGPGHCVFLTPQGKRLDQGTAVALAHKDHIILVCGRYEGVDERFRQLYVDEEISLGDFVLSGGETAAMAVVEAVTRLVPGVMGNCKSAAQESFSEGLLEYPQYTRPAVFRGLEVPAVLRSGDHRKIASWRRQTAAQRTAVRRPDLLAQGGSKHWARRKGKDAVPFAQGAADGRAPVDGRAERKNLLTKRAARTYVALLHHPVYDRNGQVVTTALTNLDLHDISRAARTFALAGYYVVTPVEKQRQLVGRIVDHWLEGYGGTVNRRRKQALELVSVATDIEEMRSAIAARHNVSPLIVVTTARTVDRPLVNCEALFERPETARRPVILCFGTGWGLTQEVVESADLCLQPIHGPGTYNHLSVRSAVSIYLARLFERRGMPAEGE
jgi:tRNA (guanine37-N1)-methyltransferase